MNTGVHKFFGIGVSGFLGYNPSRGITGSKGSSIFSFLRKFHVFHSAQPSFSVFQQGLTWAKPSVPLVNWCPLVLVWGLRNEPASMWLWDGPISGEWSSKLSGCSPCKHLHPPTEYVYQVLPSYSVFSQTLMKSPGYSLWVSILDLLQLQEIWDLVV